MFLLFFYSEEIWVLSKKGKSMVIKNRNQHFLSHVITLCQKEREEEGEREGGQMKGLKQWTFPVR